jgi:DNA-binding NtrC family response regulator
VIQEGTYERVGSSLWRQSRFRLVCATNRDLRHEVANGRFRADLYHRLAAWTVRLPPLGERPEDIPPLAMHFLRQLRPDLGEPAIDDAVLDVLRRRAYPGNVRELRQLVARLSGRHVGPAPITVGDLPPDERPPEEQKDGDRRDDGLERWVRTALAGNVALRDIRRAAEETAIAVALEEAAGNLHGASRRLKVTDRALQMRRAAARRNGTES